MSAKPLHLLRTAAGIASLDHLSDVQEKFRTVDLGGGQCAVVISTKRKPIRADELLNGGSVYWIIKHMIKARQSIIDVKLLEDEKGDSYCNIYLAPQIMLTRGISHRAIQGWRYLSPEKAPDDIGIFSVGDHHDDIPLDMVQDLRESCLI